jgi:hypothetical protein
MKKVREFFNPVIKAFGLVAQNVPIFDFAIYLKL